MITSCVKNVGNVPTFLINDKPVSQTAYITYFEDKNCYRDFADCGYNLFSVPIVFASRTINEADPAPVFLNGIYENEKPDYSILDESINKILTACPCAYIFPRVNVNLPTRWEKSHPDDLCFESYVENKCACFASDAWAEVVNNVKNNGSTLHFLGLFSD